MTCLFLQDWESSATVVSVIREDKDVIIPRCECSRSKDPVRDGGIVSYYQVLRFLQVWNGLQDPFFSETIPNKDLCADLRLQWL